MKQGGFSQIILLGIVAVFVLAGAGIFLILQEKKVLDSEKIVQQEIPSRGTKEEMPLREIQSQNTKIAGLGDLCSGEDECIYFCQNNRDRCEDYCHGKKIDLCKKIFPPDEANNQNRKSRESSLELRKPEPKLIPPPLPTLSPSPQSQSKIEEFTIAEPQKWIPDVFTQPVPPGASKTRLTSLPAPMEKFFLGIGAFGSHQGQHTEGLDHEWFQVPNGIPLGSWADGEVTRVYRNAYDDTWRIVMDYGDGLIGEYMAVKTPLVNVGDKIQSGQPVGFGEELPMSPGYHNAEFVLGDRHRRDGVQSWLMQYGSAVSPFDYLEENLKQQLISEFKKQVIEPYSEKEQSLGSVHPWEPYLTNPMLLHRQNKGSLIGEWVLKSKWASDDKPDVLVFLPANPTYYRKQNVFANDEAEERFLGTWEADYPAKRMIMNNPRGTIYQGKIYGIFDIDETGPRAILKIEFKADAYPESFGDKAFVYIERGTLPLRQDATDLGVRDNPF